MLLLLAWFHTKSRSRQKCFVQLLKKLQILHMNTSRGVNPTPKNKHKNVKLTSFFSWPRTATYWSFVIAVKVDLQYSLLEVTGPGQKNTFLYISTLHYYALSISLDAPPLVTCRHTRDLIKLQPQSGRYDLNQAI